MIKRPHFVSSNVTVPIAGPTPLALMELTVVCMVAPYTAAACESMNAEMTTNLNIMLLSTIILGSVASEPQRPSSALERIRVSMTTYIMALADLMKSLMLATAIHPTSSLYSSGQFSGGHGYPIRAHGIPRRRISAPSV